MRVLHLGGSGNLGSRVVPALVAHGHTVFAYVRSPSKLRDLIPIDVFQQITVIQGDAFDTEAIANALREYKCDAIVNTAGTREQPWKEQTLGPLVASITSAAITVGKERAEPLRAWIIGGMGSLRYPGTGYNIQDYLPAWMSEHHRGTESVMKAISTDDLDWSLLCVAMMYPESEPVKSLEGPRGNNLLVAARSPPGWKDHWVRSIPVIGIYLNLFPVIRSYSALYEEVGDLIASDLKEKLSSFKGELVGYKSPTIPKTL